MKTQFLFVFYMAIAVVFATSCKTEGDAARDAAMQQIQGGQPAVGDPAAGAAATTTTPAANPATPTPEPAQNAAGVWHYTCPKGCAGGAGSAVACAKCGTTLAHNQAYHANNNDNKTTVTTSSGANVSLPEGIKPVPSPLTNPPATPTEPAQNAKGVWHYTCSGGCAGGAGSAIACAKCGKTLAHNQAYHQ
jgi:ribosomal protein S27E